MKPDKIDHEETYVVSDPDEEIQLLKAMNLNNHIISEEEITKMLRD
jgi:histidinol phosphatase-like enzyme